MNSIIRRAGSDIAEPLRRFLEGDMGPWLRVEEYRDGGDMVVKAEVPGIDPDKDVDITLIGSDLRIEVRHEEKSEHRDKRGYRSEFRYGTFSRTVALPGPVNESDIHASYTDGVLEVRVPVPDETTTASRKIRVSRANAGTSNAGTSSGMGSAGGMGGASGTGTSGTGTTGAGTTGTGNATGTGTTGTGSGYSTGTTSGTTTDPM
ncbi:Hsp20/alpha crystallin family protein [Arthrobacter sp. CDRTa11]|uniref:Hsp20/alpha crystallin family protein n=1 Tax=Arthrobacter sp. CDRTa11 TaxID=2651199 RepID=UPI002265B140|nr:Hsp20/alpha crystallin family protein [Arthrobacter sp. CDRTa11]UZX04356.1 Hsp20/alpha crystallin family protein [Arthrobacter sp. CDRTa11]